MDSPESKETPELSDHAILGELARITASRYFKLSKRNKQFLEFIVKATLEGRSRDLKERLIGMELYGRKPDYSTGEDPVVRVQAGDVRRRLELYAANGGQSDVVTIEMPTGSYVPVFKARKTKGKDQSNDASEPNGYTSPPSFGIVETNLAANGNDIGRNAFPIHSDAFPGISALPAPRLKRSKSVVVIVSALACLGILFSFTLFRAYSDTGPVEEFWGPVLKSPKPVLICLPKPTVYKPTVALVDRLAKEHPEVSRKEMEDNEIGLPINPDTMIRWGDLAPRENIGPGVGSVVAAINFSKLFTSLGKDFEVRFGRNASFAQLRDSPGIVVGFTNTQWMDDITITSKLPLEITHEDGRMFHESTGHRTWRAAFGSQGKKILDYGLVTRLLTSETGQPIVVVAGITDRGTEAAGELITNKTELANASKTFPKGWEKKNLQILVSTKITEGKAGPPLVIESRIW